MWCNGTRAPSVVGRSPQHVECVAYLLVHGADVYAQTSRGDNALHIAAKHGNAGCLHALLSAQPQADGDGGTALLGDVIVQGDTGPTKLIDLHNGGAERYLKTCFTFILFKWVKIETTYFHWIIDLHNGGAPLLWVSVLV